eukprot:XP_787018.3 PREDICTED: peptidoglycan-recognition protein SC2 [Strongylocentrotus purpuratus]
MRTSRMQIFATMGSLFLALTCLLVFAICDCRVVERPRIISRSEWGARSPTSTTNLNTNLPYAVVHHTDTISCTTEASCKSLVQKIQNFHMDTKGWSDIGYNYLIGGDGNVYEGRGSNNRGAHAAGYNSKSIGISVIGRFSSSAPKQNQLKMLDKVLKSAVKSGTLQPSYTLIGHRHVSRTVCPGDALYNELEEFEHFTFIGGSGDNP